MYTHNTHTTTHMYTYAPGVLNVHYLLEVALLSAHLLLLHLLLHAASVSAILLAVDYFPHEAHGTVSEGENRRG